jgi:hypothetical protein
MPRTAKIHRKTNETDIHIRLNLDGRGTSQVSSGIRFLDHMLDLVARHGAFDLTLKAKGDLDVDQHHTVEVVYTADKKRAAIGLAGRRRDGEWHVEVADYLDSTSQVVARVKQIRSRAARKGRTLVGVAVDPKSHEGACIKGLELARIPVVKMTSTDVTTAYAGFYESVTDAHDLHHRGQDDLTLALVGASARLVGDAGEAWGRKASGVEIAPLVAVTNARWLHERDAPELEIEPGAWAL